MLSSIFVIIKEKIFEGLALRFRITFTVKLIFAAILIFLIITFMVYSIEKNHIVYKYENGIKVEDRESSSNIRSVPDSIWWAFVTATTVGYGDHYPKSNEGRFFAVFLMFFGIVMMGIITGNIASYLVEKQLKEERGLKGTKLRNHFVICGWKREMVEILRDILSKNSSFKASQIVLVNSAPPEEIDNIKSDREFSKINFVSGDHIDERTLKRASIQNAKKVLILADRLLKGSVQEVDSKTVMAVITIKSLAKNAYVAAEILDSKFHSYLMFNNCDEIILTSDYNRALLANASAGSGISHIISALFNVRGDVCVNTEEIPDSFVGEKYDDLYSHYFDKNRTLLLGILENSGNFFVRKKEAIEEAQKTADISKLVDNLKHVKTLIPNQPVINPAGDYIIKKNSRAILVERNIREISQAGYY